MDIDIERLKTDAEYWLDSDPSDGEATHFELEYSGHECAWVRVDRKGLRHYFLDGGWVCADMTNDDIGPVDRMIPRPAKPASLEYPRMAVMVNPHEAPLHYGEEALGKEIEVIEWLPDESCYVVRFDWGLGVLHDSMVDFGLYEARTKERRQRDELVDLMEAERENYFPKAVTAEEIADAILSRYNLEPKDA